MVWSFFTLSPNGYLNPSPAWYRTTKGTGPARFGSAPVVTKKQELELNQPLIITFVVPNRDGDSGLV